MNLKCFGFSNLYLFVLLEAPPSYYSLFPSSLSPNNIGRQVRRGISSGGDGEDSSGSGNRAASVAKISGCLGND